MKIILGKKKYCFCDFNKKGKYTVVTKIKTESIIKKKIKKLKIIAFSKGKGFCGVIKKHKFSSNRKTHGNSKSHNKPGSIGMCQDPGKVFKGKKMPGRLGGKKNTIICKVLKKINNIILIKGTIPGFNNSKIKISYENKN
ncbi:50S ribosomal protein L3 [Candidatus Vidania fulgoroideorum]